MEKTYSVCLITVKGEASKPKFDGALLKEHDRHPFIW